MKKTALILAAAMAFSHGVMAAEETAAAASTGFLPALQVLVLPVLLPSGLAPLLPLV